MSTTVSVLCEGGRLRRVHDLLRTLLVLVWGHVTASLRMLLLLLRS